MGTTPQPITLQTPQQAQTPVNPPQIDFSSIYQDPQFNSMPLSQQRQVLSRVDPDFNDFTDADYFAYRQRSKFPLPSQSAPPPPSLKDQFINLVRPSAAALATMGGAAAAGGPIDPPGAAAAGAASGLGTDMILQGLMDNPQGLLSSKLGFGPRTPEDSLTNAAEMLLGNELGGKVTSGLFKGIRAAGQVSGVTPVLEQFYQQYFGSPKIAPWVRSLIPLIPLNKGKGINVDSTAEDIQAALMNNRDLSLAESNKQAETAKLIAKANPVAIISNVRPANLTTPGNPAPIVAGPGGIYRAARVVEGPIDLKSTLQAAQDYLRTKQKLFFDPTTKMLKPSAKDEPLITAAQNFLNVSDAKIDSRTGSILSSNPISFEDAWAFKREMDTLFKSNPEAGGFARSLNSDIDASIPKWQNDPHQAALGAWQNAKATVAQRLGLFEDDGVRQLIETTNSPVPAIDAIINDPKKLQRALSAGNLQMPSGNVASSNMKEDLRGYTLTKLLNDPANAQKTFNDPDMDSSYGQLFSDSERNEIGKFIDNLNNSSISKSFGSTRAWLMPGGVGLSAALMHHSITPWQTGAEAALGFKVGSVGLSRLLTNPKTARIMQAMSSNQPLGVSDQYASKVITSVLQGAGMSMLTNDGKEIQGTVDAKGNFTPQSAQNQNQNQD